jgi:NTP pyrophosphatase (non-canonical NTP hydrolase)
LKRQEIFELINRERSRQEQLHPKWFNINEMSLSILAEEFGEVAKAINDCDYENLQDELVQVISVCFRWLENMPDETTEKNVTETLLKDKKLTKEQIEAWERLGYDMGKWKI